jgi:vesicle-fusing ATPase
MNFVSEQPPSVSHSHRIFFPMHANIPQAHGKSLLVIGTTSQSSALRQLDLFQLFNKTIAVPNVNTHEELDAVLREANAFGNAADRTEALNALMEMTGHEQVGVSVKQVLLAVELAKMDEGNVMGQFAELIMAQMQRAMD